MADIDIDISQQQAKSVDTIDPASIDLVIILYAEEVCPILPGRVKRLHWPITDPAAASPDQTAEEIQARFHSVRDQIKTRIDVLRGLPDLPAGPDFQEFHGSIRGNNLPDSMRFYAWLLNI